MYRVLKSMTYIQPDNGISISDWNIPKNIELNKKSNETEPATNSAKKKLRLAGS